MRYAIDVSRHAASQIREADAWWKLHRPLAPHAVIDDVERAFDLLAIQPGIGSRARNSSNRDVRRILLGRINHHVYYIPSDDDRTVRILALWHVRRGRAPRLGAGPEPD